MDRPVAALSDRSSIHEVCSDEPGESYWAFTILLASWASRSTPATAGDEARYKAVTASIAAALTLEVIPAEQRPTLIKSDQRLTDQSMTV